MTRAEQEAFEKWMEDNHGKLWRKHLYIRSVEMMRAFLAGYRAGFEAQHYEVGDA